MEGNWEISKSSGHMPNQQLQHPQQQQEQQQLSLHSATTPVWGITDRIAKEEPVEDRNNDSGVSPDHYTSNSASPSTSTANCSLSPSSSASQDSSNMQCSTFNFNGQGLFRNVGSPHEYSLRNSMDENQLKQAMDVVSSAMRSSSENTEAGDEEVLQCPICAATSTNRSSFSEHLSTHCSSNCDTQNFVRAILTQLTASGSSSNASRSSPPQGERSGQEFEDAEEPGLRVPRVNSQGKVKTFKCKQCPFVAITKLEFWEHSRTHIKAEKLLTCPRCPFVTEYKHHLEYHLRNHFGSKPFKCDKCPYSCVNKSMLNSHLKSHSNVYQYRCSNCSYATKYCHSLKLHLRKYIHEPAMVLNADGSPNPLPIIDVYGTRRGPKQKPVKQDDTEQESTAITSNTLDTSVSSPELILSQVSPINQDSPTKSVNGMNVANPMNGLNIVNPMNGLNVTNPINSLNGLNVMSSMNSLNGVAQSQPMIPFAYPQLFTGFPMAQFASAEDNSSDKQLDQQTRPMGYARSVDIQQLTEELPQNLIIKNFESNVTSNGIFNGLASNEISRSNEMPSTSASYNRKECSDVGAVPLDLSKPDTASSNTENKPVKNSPKATGTSRRKGKAVKLERRAMQDSYVEEQPPHKRLAKVQENASALLVANTSGAEEANDERSFSCNGEFTCQYCEIVFGNMVMHTVHMGYHGYNDPYTCNMCGHQCDDKVSFFLHIAKSKHA